SGASVKRRTSPWVNVVLGSQMMDDQFGEPDTWNEQMSGLLLSTCSRS
ncbi:hypothetical protein Tco_1297231, partial [Tanacetum coccineum]